MYVLLLFRALLACMPCQTQYCSCSSLTAGLPQFHATAAVHQLIGQAMAELIISMNSMMALNTSLTETAGDVLSVNLLLQLFQPGLWSSQPLTFACLAG